MSRYSGENKRQTAENNAVYNQVTLGQNGHFIVGSSDPFYDDINPTGASNKILASVGSIANVSGDTWRITLSSPTNVDLSRVSKACFISISGADNSDNNGNFKVVAFDDTADTIDVENPNGVAQVSDGGQAVIEPPRKTAAIRFLGSTLTISSLVFADADGASFPTASLQDGQVIEGSISECVMSAGNAQIYYI